MRITSRRLAFTASGAALGAALATALFLPAGAQARPAALPLAPAAVVRIPALAARPVLRTDANAPLANGEYSAEVRTPADRLALADAIARRRARENQRWANDGPGVAVPLRRSRS